MKNKILIINSIYYREISENLLKGSKKVLNDKNIQSKIIEVPGPVWA